MGRKRNGKGKQTVRPTAVPTVGASTEGREEDRGKDNDSAKTTSSKGFADERQLLSGIPNEITLNHITTKLPWKAFHILSSVSRGWRNAIRNYEVYHARVRSHSTETLVAINHVLVENEDVTKEVDGMSLYSMTDETFHKLPPIPGLRQGVPRCSSCVFLDGKIYVLGGISRGADVYVLDLVGQREWKRCADMQNPRSNFECDVLDGKIYALGGTSVVYDPREPGSSKAYSLGGKSEVYDPRNNSWSSIAPMRTSRWCFKVGKIGNKLTVYGGIDHRRGTRLFCAEVYDPEKDEWTVSQVGKHGDIRKAFMARGRFYRMTMNDISVCDLDKEKLMHSFWLPQVHSPGNIFSSTDWLFCSVRAVGDELMINESTYGVDKLCVVVSKGFGTERKDLQWERVDCPFSYKKHYGFPSFTPFICEIQL